MAFKLPRLWRTRATATNHTYAATTLNARSITMGLQIPKTGQQWQAKAWDYYEVIPEVRQVVEHRANAISKVLIQVAQMGEDGKPEVAADQRADEFLDWLYGGREHHGTHLTLLTQQLTVAGESYLVIVDPQRDIAGQDNDVTRWFTLAPDSIDTTYMGGASGYVTIKDPETGLDRRFYTSQDPDQPGVRVIRIWKPHPRRQWEADSPMRGAISILSTISHLNASIKSAAKSRLIGGGIYPIPLEAQLPQPTDQDPAGTTPVDKFRSDIHEGAAIAIRDPESAAAQLPLFVHVPADAIKAMLPKPIDFSTTFDERLPELLDKALYRFAQGMPTPTGKIDTSEGNQNHWNKWGDREEELQVDIMPLTSLELGALTAHILQPLLGDGFFLKPDYTELVTRPDRTPEAIELYTAEIITLPEAREMSGFPEQFDAQLLKQVENQQKPALKVTSERVNNRNDPPERQPVRDEPGEFSAAVVVDNLLVRDLLRETGKRMLTSAPRSVRGAMTKVPEERRCQEFDGAFSAFEAVAPRVLERYLPVLTPEQLDAGRRAAFNELRHD